MLPSRSPSRQQVNQIPVNNPHLPAAPFAGCFVSVHRNVIRPAAEALEWINGTFFFNSLAHGLLLTIRFAHCWPARSAIPRNEFWNAIEPPRHGVGHSRNLISRNRQGFSEYALRIAQPSREAMIRLSLWSLYSLQYGSVIGFSSR